MNISIFLILLMVCSCIGNENYQKISIFIPTDDWQEIEPGQSIPKGLHVRINLTTGKKEAKLLDDTDVSGKENYSVALAEQPVKETQNENNNEMRLHDLKELIKTLKNIKPDFVEKDIEANVKKKFRSIKELKEELAELNLVVRQGPSMVIVLVDQFVSSTSNQDKLHILVELEYLLHELDAATDFIKIEGSSKVIIPGLNSTNVEIRKQAMSVIGAAAQSNPTVQINFLEEKILIQLMTLLTHEDDIFVQIRCLYGISSLIRGFPFGQMKFIDMGGLDTLLKLFLKANGEVLPLQIKIITLIRNLQEEKINAVGERAWQLRDIDFSEKLAEGGWCPVIGVMLKFSINNDYDDRRIDYDVVEPVIDVMNHLLPLCKTNYVKYERILHALAYILKENFDSNDDPLLNMVFVLLRGIGIKDEL